MLMRNLIKVILYCINTGSAYRVSAAGVNITIYGAVGDGHTLNTWAMINQVLTWKKNL